MNSFVSSSPLSSNLSYISLFLNFSFPLSSTPFYHISQICPNSKILPSYGLPISLELLIPSTDPNMAGDERRSSKRSRFDQTEPEVKRSSRFDRRSRSPISRHTDSRRSRSPVAHKSPFSPSEEKTSSAIDPSAAAGKPMTQSGR